MKKLLLPILAIVLLYGCSKTNSTKTTTGNIVGKWYLTVDSSAIYDNGKLTSSSRDITNHTSYAIYNADGTGSSVDFSVTPADTTTFTYKVSGSNITMNFPQHTYDTVTEDAYSLNGTIRTLTSSALELYFEQSDTENGETYKIVLLSDFNK